MASGSDIANGIANYFSTPKAKASDGSGDTAQAGDHAAVHDELVGQICPDCHSTVKAAMTKFLGSPAESQAAPAPAASPTATVGTLIGYPGSN